MRSMTGYGRGLAERDGRRAAVEIRAVNHRFMDVKLRGAQLDAPLEERVAGRVRERLTRGSLTVSIRLEGRGIGSALRIDQDAARRVHAELRALAAALDLEPRVPLELVCAQPGVLVPVEPGAGAASSSEAVAEATAAAVDQAIDELIAMREAEGQALARDLGQRLEHLARLTESLATETGRAPEDASKRLRERIARLLGAAARPAAATAGAAGSAAAPAAPAQVDEARLAQEIALLADRMDVTEELVRVRSHIEQVRELIGPARAGASKEAGAVGRRLDFLVQELGREFNTVASKSQSADIARLVVEAKAELEKVREQVQNIE